MSDEKKHCPTCNRPEATSLPAGEGECAVMAARAWVGPPWDAARYQREAQADCRAHAVEWPAVAADLRERLRLSEEARRAAEGDATRLGIERNEWRSRAEAAERDEEKALSERDHWQDVVADVAALVGCRQEWSNAHSHGTGCVGEALAVRDARAETAEKRALGLEAALRDVRPILPGECADLAPDEGAVKCPTDVAGIIDAALSDPSGALAAHDAEKDARIAALEAALRQAGACGFCHATGERDESNDSGAVRPCEECDGTGLCVEAREALSDPSGALAAHDAEKDARIAALERDLSEARSLVAEARRPDKAARMAERAATLADLAIGEPTWLAEWLAAHDAKVQATGYAAGYAAAMRWAATECRGIALRSNGTAVEVQASQAAACADALDALAAKGGGK